MFPEVELRNDYYEFWNLFLVIVLLIFNLSQIKRKKQILCNVTKHIQFRFIQIARKNIKLNFLATTTFWAVLEIIILSCMQVLPISFLNPMFGDLAGTNVNYFGTLFFIPIILMIFYCIIWVDPIKQMDLITPAFPLALVCAKIGCYCAGCCRGMEWGHGVYNYKYEYNQVPVQLVEAAVALLIFVFFMYWRKKAKPGTMYPIYVILYSATRFFTEFLRGEENIFGILKTYHILCIIGVVVGLVEFFIVLRFSDKISTFFETKRKMPTEKLEKIAEFENQRNKDFKKKVEKLKKKIEVKRKKGRIRF